MCYLSCQSLTPPSISWSVLPMDQDTVRLNESNSTQGPLQNLNQLSTSEEGTWSLSLENPDDVVHWCQWHLVHLHYTHSSYSFYKNINFHCRLFSYTHFWIKRCKLSYTCLFALFFRQWPPSTPWSLSASYVWYFISLHDSAHGDNQWQDDAGSV